MRHRRFACARLPDPYMTRSQPRLLTMTFTTADFDRSSSWQSPPARRPRCLHLSHSTTPARLLDTTPPRLLTVAACGGLKPAPDGRLRGTFPHLLRSSAPPLLSVRSWHTVVRIPAEPVTPSGQFLVEIVEHEVA